MTTRRAHLPMENLEKRVLFALIEATDFGASPDDGNDDGGAIQRALDAAQPGDTVTLAPGLYEIDGHVNLRRGVRLDGQTRAATLRHTGSDDSNSMLYVSEDDVTIEALRIEGQVKAEHAANFTFTRNYVTNDESGAFSGNGLYMPGRLDGSTITWNHFDDIGHRGVYFLNQHEMVIEDNLFTGCAQAVSGHFFGDSSGSSVSWNTVTGFRRHGIELQNGDGAETLGLTVEGNHVHSPAARQGSMFLSLAMGSGDDRISRGMVVRKNVLIANGNIPDKFANEWRNKKYMSTAFELMGTDFTVEDNFAAGFGWYQLVGNNGGEWVSRNNTFVGTEQVPANADRRGGIGGEIAPEHGYTTGPSELANRILNVDSIGDLKDVPAAGVRKGNVRRDDGSRGVVEDKKENGSSEAAKPRAPRPGTDDARDAGGNEAADVITYLSDLEWRNAFSGWGPVEIDTNNGERREGDGEPLKINGTRYDKGLGVSMHSEIEYRLDGAYQRFQADVGIDDRAGPDGSMTFEVWADGKKVYDSGTLTGRSNAKAVEVGVDGVKSLKLVTTDAGDGGRLDHGNWARARLTGPDAS